MTLMTLLITYYLLSPLTLQVQCSQGSPCAAQKHCQLPMQPACIAAELGDFLLSSADVLCCGGVHQRNPGIAQDHELLGYTIL